MKVHLFVTCLADVFERKIGIATVELLERLGCEVIFPESQSCCGQPAYNSGFCKQSNGAIKNIIKSFLDADYIVSPAGSCAAFIKEYAHILQDEPQWAEKAKQVSERTYDLSQFIVNVLGITDVGAKLNGKATYHTSCHMTRLLGAEDEPFKLLNAVEGLELIPLRNAHQCCGFGGTFSVKMGDISGQMVDEKVDHVLETGADYLISGDGGCILNIRGRLQRRNEKVQVLHLAEVLNRRG
ncbi:MAG: (Fe-S)-binding protein [Bacillaceae bacterium]